MKICPECGDSNRDDAKQCVCGRPFGFELPPGLNRDVRWGETAGNAGPVTEDSQTVFGAQLAPQTTICHAPVQPINPYATEPAHMVGKGTAMGGGVGCMIGFCMIGTGVVALFVPFIGWVLGPVFIVGGLMAPFVMGAMVGLTAVGRLHGHCPYCGIAVAGKGLGITCDACHGRIIIRDKQFLPAPTTPLTTNANR